MFKKTKSRETPFLSEYLTCTISKNPEVATKSMTYINFVVRVSWAVKLHYNMIYHYKLQLFIWSNCVHWKLSSQANNETVLKYRSCFWRQWQATPVLSAWMEEPGRLQSIGLRRVGHNWVTTFTFPPMHWRRKWQPTPAFLPGESRGRGSLVGCRLWGHTVIYDWSDLAAAAAIWVLEIFLPCTFYRELI